MNKKLQTVEILTTKQSGGVSVQAKTIFTGYFFTPEELEEIKKEIEWGTLYDPCENCGGGHIRPCNHCGDLGFHRKYYTTEELEKFKAEWQREAAEKAWDAAKKHFVHENKKYDSGFSWLLSDIGTPDKQGYLNAHYPIK